MANPRIHPEIACQVRQLPYADCRVGEQSTYERVARNRRSLDFSRSMAWLHVAEPNTDRGMYDKTIQGKVPWARPSNGLTLLFKTLSLFSYQTTPVAHAMAQVRIVIDYLWQRIHHYVTSAHKRDRIAKMGAILIDGISVKKEHAYVIALYDLEARRQVFMAFGRPYGTVTCLKKPDWARRSCQ